MGTPRPKAGEGGASAERSPSPTNVLAMPPVAPGRWEDGSVKQPVCRLREEDGRDPEPPGPLPQRPRRSPRPPPVAMQGAAALLLYATTSIALVGSPILSVPSNPAVWRGADPAF